MMHDTHIGLISKSLTLFGIMVLAASLSSCVTAHQILLVDSYEVGANELLPPLASGAGALMPEHEQGREYDSRAYVIQIPPRLARRIRSDAEPEVYASLFNCVVGDTVDDLDNGSVRSNSLYLPLYEIQAQEKGEVPVGPRASGEFIQVLVPLSLRRGESWADGVQARYFRDAIQGDGLCLQLSAFEMPWPMIATNQLRLQPISDLRVLVVE